MKKKLALAFAILLALALATGYTPDTDPAAMRAKYSTAASRFIPLRPGLTAHVRDEGVRTGRTLVLIHGGGSSLHTWEPWAKILGEKHRVITFDLPGHGLTGPNASGRYTQQAFADFTLQLMTKLGVESAVIGGNSMGGGIAWWIATQQPGRCESLILLDSVGSPVGPVRAALSRIARTPALGQMLTWWTPRWLVASGVRAMYHDATRLSERTIDRYWELSRYPGSRNAAMSRFASAAENPVASKDELARFTKPVLVQWGANDRAIAPEAARWFASSFPHAKLATYAEAGHLPMEETPAATAADVLDFLR